MGGVECCDQEISFHPTNLKCKKKYYKDILLHLLDKVLWNSFLRSKNVVGKRITFLEFRIYAVEALLRKCDNLLKNGIKNSGRPPTVDNPARLSDLQVAPHIPLTPAKRDI
ncbi:hypothetical protein TNCV_3812721 [Trichonephila clavipes]|nr:hypothetical protein TNCV_3812721 [Trichonephila clavipes]